MVLSDDGRRLCPRCAREMAADFVVCPYCASPLPGGEPVADAGVEAVPGTASLAEEPPQGPMVPMGTPPEPEGIADVWVIELDDEDTPALPLSPSAGKVSGPAQWDAPASPRPGPAQSPPVSAYAQQPYGVTEQAYPYGQQACGYGQQPGLPYAAAAADMHWAQPMPDVGFWPRIAAYLIDSSIVGGPLGFLIGVHVGMTVPDEDAMQQIVAHVMSVRYLLLLMTVVYFALMNGRYGATLGKMALGLKVVRADGSRIGYGLALGRILLEMVFGGCTVWLFFISVAVDREHRGWHDKICGTRVIYNR